jgi:hypothetical protein
LQVTNFLHWRKMTWVVVLWSGYLATWAVITGSGAAILAVWWLAGVVVFRPRWFATQPVFGQGRSLEGFVRAVCTRWRVVNLHRTNRGTEARRNAG